MHSGPLSDRTTFGTPRSAITSANSVSSSSEGRLRRASSSKHSRAYSSTSTSHLIKRPPSSRLNKTFQPQTSFGCWAGCFWIPPFARAEESSLSCLPRHFEALLPPKSVDTLRVHGEAHSSQQLCAYLGNFLNEIVHSLADAAGNVVRLLLVALRGSRLSDRSTARRSDTSNFRRRCSTDSRRRVGLTTFPPAGLVQLRVSKQLLGHRVSPGQRGRSILSYHMDQLMGSTPLILTM